MSRVMAFGLIVVLASGLSAASAADLLDDDTRQLSFQARLTDGGGIPLVGLHDLEFKIYDDPNIAAHLPTGGPFGITVDISPADDGVVSVLLPGGGVGLDAALFDGTVRYLGMSIDGGVELTPRIQLGAVPHAMRTNFVGNTELTDDVTLGDPNTGSMRIYRAGVATAVMSLDGNDGQITTFSDLGTETMSAGSSSQAGGFVLLRQDDGSTGVVVDGFVPGQGGLIAGYTPSPLSNKSFELLGSDGDGLGRFTLLAGDGGVGGPGGERVRIDASGLGSGSELKMWNSSSTETVTVYSAEDDSALIALWNDLGVATLGLDADDADNGALIRMRNGFDQETIQLDASKGTALSSQISLLHPGGGTGGGGGMVETVELVASETGADGGQIKVRDATGSTTIELDGDWNGLGEGRVVTDVLEIKGGADLSEQFNVSAESVVPGMVVSIDPANPGQLIASTAAYDRKVAGIVSGAGGVRPGMLMGQTGSIADGAHPIALSGRVYCLVDTSNGLVVPGDLLTSSSQPGYAMKVTNHDQARGAIIGKAMTPLTEGQGLVLVLVSLQ